MNKLKVNMRFLNSMIDLARYFRTSTDTKGDSVCEVSYIGIGTKKTKEKLPQFMNKKFVLGPKDKNMIYKYLVHTEQPHKQALKMIKIELQIKNVSRSVLFEFDRHPIGHSGIDQDDFFNDNNDCIIKSTRYTIGRISKDERLETTLPNKKHIEDVVEDYFYIPENLIDDEISCYWYVSRYKELVLYKHLKENFKLKNDEIKQLGINDNMYCNIQTIVSGEWLKNFLQQRLQKDVYPPMRQLAKTISDNIPNDWKDIFKVFKYKYIEKNEIDNIESGRRFYIKEYLK